MSVEKILSAWKENKFSPLYWFEGEEDYYIDVLVNYAENHILPASEASFNLTVFYGKDADWAAVINACRRYPMNAEKQVVLIKEAQFMKDIDKLEPYFLSPLATTLLLVAYKTKKLDKRLKFFKTIQSRSTYFYSPKIREDKLQEWIHEMVKARGYQITNKAAILLEEHIGNDLNRMANEIEKISVNLKGKNNITEDEIELYIGISKEYNIFELLGAIAVKDMAKALKIVNYFEANPKAAPMQAALPALYSSLSRVYGFYGQPDQSESALRQMMFHNPVAISQAKGIMKHYGYPGIEKLLLLLHHYNLKSIGIGDTGTPGAVLMKEMLFKMMI